MKKTAIIIFTAILALCASCNLDPADFPTASPQGGTVDYGTSITLHTTASDVQIRYTIDGTKPTYESTLYESSIQLTENTVLKFAAFNNKRRVSKVVVEQYSVKAAKPTANVPAGDYCVAYGSTDGIALSCDTEGADIYYTLDGSDPRTSSTRVKYSQAIVFPMAIPTRKEIRMYATSQCNIDSDINEVALKVYFKGPAGGYVFYDCDADNDETNNGAGPDKLKSSTCGWKYLEAAPENITVETTTTFIFGHYRTSANGDNLFVNGTTYVEGTSDPNDGKSTGTAIGTGKANTAKLVGKMASAAYYFTSGSATTANYAAKLCDNYTYGGFSDWFLPSKDELNLMYRYLKTQSIGGLGADGSYWSSSENDTYASDAWYHVFSIDYKNSNGRGSTYRVRAVRAFTPLPSSN